MILPLLPLTHAFLGLVGLAWHRTARSSLYVSCVIDAGLVGLLLAARSSPLVGPILVGSGVEPIGIRLAADDVSVVFLLLAVILEAAVTLFLRRERLRPYFYMLLHLLFGASFALVVSRDLFNMYVILELLTLVSFLLVGYERRPTQIWASLKYLVLASFGMAVFLLGVSVVYRHTGVLDINALAEAVRSAGDARWIPVAAALLAGGAAVKAGIFGFSLWLPAAHATAPSAVSALLSGLVIKMGIVVIARLSTAFPLTTPLLALGMLTGIVGAVYAAFSRDLKRLLAFSTLSQMGYILVGVAVDPTGFPFLAYVLAHGCFKALLFLAAGEASRFVNSTHLRTLIAQRQSVPLGTRLALLVGTIGIVGVPPFAGYVAKASLVAPWHGPALHAALAIISFGTAVSFAKLLPLLWWRETSSNRSRAVGAYLVLGAPVLGFLPIHFALFGGTATAPVWSWSFALESMFVLSVGTLTYRFLRRLAIPLPQRIFRIEDSVFSVLLGVFLLFLLLRFT